MEPRIQYAQTADAVSSAFQAEVGSKKLLLSFAPLVPASMQLLGDLNWYLPKWLHWLPDIRVEGAAGGGN